MVMDVLCPQHTPHAPHPAVGLRMRAHLTWNHFSLSAAARAAAPLLALHRDELADHRARLGQQRQEVVSNQLAGLGSRLLAFPHGGKRTRHTALGANRCTMYISTNRLETIKVGFRL